MIGIFVEQTLKKLRFNFAFRFLYNLIVIPLHLFLVIPFFIIAWTSQFFVRRIDVGIGPDTLINNIYHKKAIMACGYSAETFVLNSNFITNDFDVNFEPGLVLRFFLPYYFFLRALFRYKILFMYFTGGSLRFKTILRWFEPLFYKVANLKTVLMPFGTDVQIMYRASNLYFKHAMTTDYPGLRWQYKKTESIVDRWTSQASWIISGCDWVDYTYYWDTLMLSHICIDMHQWEPDKRMEKTRETVNRPFRILHAPNHLAQKGTAALMRACEKLKSEGLDIELILLTKVSNDKIREVMRTVDLVADQFVIGWYAMFSIEAMSMGKPVLCYLREDLLDLYTKAGLIQKHEIPLINTTLPEIPEKIKWAYQNREQLALSAAKGRDFVRQHHSLESMSKEFSKIIDGLK